MNNHTQLLNWLIGKYNLKSYLEIGVQARRQNFDKINVHFKVGVDPMVTEPLIYSVPSDVYFDSMVGEMKFDLIFLDGLHHADQVKRDFENSLKCLNDGGFILIHDTLPEQEITTCVPRGSQKVWHGDVYKWAMVLGNYDDIKYYTINMDNGCTVVSIFPGEMYGLGIPYNSVTWKDYIENRKDFMNIIAPSEIEKYL